MSATTRWIFRTSAAAALVAIAAPAGTAQVVVPNRAQPLGERPRTFTPARQPPPASPIVGRKPSIIAMPSVNGSPGAVAPGAQPPRWNSSFDSSWTNPPHLPLGPVVMDPQLFNPGGGQPRILNRPVRNPIVVNQLLMNPLLGNRAFLDPLNGPLVGGWGVPVFPPRRDEGALAAARRPGSLSEETPEFSTKTIAAAAYQPLSGIVTLADGTTYYRGDGEGIATELGNYSAGGGLDAGLLGGTFYRPAAGSNGDLGRAGDLLPYIW